MTELENFEKDIQLFNELLNKLEDLQTWFCDNRDNGLNGSQPTLSIVSTSLSELFQFVEKRSEKVQLEFAKLIEVEEARKKLEDRIKGLNRKA